MKLLRLLLPAFLLVYVGCTPALSGQRKVAQPNSATEWFRRADQRIQLRLPGSAPFHMQVAFSAFPGEDFSPPGQSPILTGDGVYEETWLSPDNWRREVRFGTYHAFETRANGVRKFEASSEYEPSRVLMLLDALLDIVPRNFVSPEVEMAEPHWKVHTVRRADVPVIRLRYDRDSPYIPASSVWEFSPDGQPLRAASAGLSVTWQNARPFAGRWFPAAITGATKSRTLLTGSTGTERCITRMAQKRGQWQAGPPLDGHHGSRCGRPPGAQIPFHELLAHPVQQGDERSAGFECRH